jgi:hypothetical protein
MISRTQGVRSGTQITFVDTSCLSYESFITAAPSLVVAHWHVQCLQDIPKKYKEFLFSCLREKGNINKCSQTHINRENKIRSFRSFI